MSIDYSPPTYDISPPSTRPEISPTLHKIHEHSRRLVASTVAVFCPEQHTFSDTHELTRWLARAATVHPHLAALDDRHDDYHHRDFVTLQDFQTRLNNIQAGTVRPTIRKRLFCQAARIINNYHQEFSPSPSSQYHRQINNNNPLED